jgi:hypothetical protein
VAVGAEVGFRRRVADQDRGVDVGGEHGGVEDARDVEPLAAEPDALPGEDPVDAQGQAASGAAVSAMTRPSSSSMRRGMRRAMSMSWVKIQAGRQTITAADLSLATSARSSKPSHAAAEVHAS